jgi:hypothetical protein
MKKLPIPEIKRAGKPSTNTPAGGDLITIYTNKMTMIHTTPGAPNVNFHFIVLTLRVDVADD